MNKTILLGFFGPPCSTEFQVRNQFPSMVMIQSKRPSLVIRKFENSLPVVEKMDVSVDSIQLF